MSIVIKNSISDFLIIDDEVCYMWIVIYKIAKVYTKYL